MKDGNGQKEQKGFWGNLWGAAKDFTKAIGPNFDDDDSYKSLPKSDKGKKSATFAEVTVGSGTSIAEENRPKVESLSGSAEVRVEALAAKETKDAVISEDHLSTKGIKGFKVLEDEGKKSMSFNEVVVVRSSNNEPSKISLKNKETNRWTWGGLGKTILWAAGGFVGSTLSSSVNAAWGAVAATVTTLYGSATDKTVHNVISAGLKLLSRNDPQNEQNLQIAEDFVRIVLPTSLALVAGGSIGVATAKALNMSATAITLAGVLGGYSGVKVGGKVDTNINMGGEFIDRKAEQGKKFLLQKGKEILDHDITRTIIGVSIVGLGIAGAVALSGATFGVAPAACLAIAGVSTLVGVGYARGWDRDIADGFGKIKKSFGNVWESAKGVFKAKDEVPISPEAAVSTQEPIINSNEVVKNQFISPQLKSTAQQIGKGLIRPENSESTTKSPHGRRTIHL